MKAEKKRGDCGFGDCVLKLNGESVNQTFLTWTLSKACKNNINGNWKCLSFEYGQYTHLSIEVNAKCISN